MKLFHKHQWQDVHYEPYWLYDYRENEYGEWYGGRKYQVDNPGRRILTDQHTDMDWYQYPKPYTTITQQCDCKKYRNQTVEGIVTARRGF